ncbi:sugar phosphate permease [Ureibacillus xyleni]|uniref:Sugar phosphate permease n=1 Tax=Ureibacillus xyleni TaxID=614648 RepID=A0A285SDC9_9BACL|nr:MFS transporter [Ureibacillus xyleni]SOC05854.1 sugar phosphate permease [Ureibacillus xyleni]
MGKQDSRYRWIVLVVTLLVYFLIISQRTAPGVITDQLMIEFQVSATIIGLMSSFQFFAYAGLQIPIGLLSDRYGPNLFLIIGTLLTGLGSIMYSFADNSFLLIFSRLIVGTGDAMIFVNLISILSQWFRTKEFVKLMGFVSLVASLGLLTATLPLSTWIEFSGWRTPFLIIGTIIVLSAILLYFVLVKKTQQLLLDEIHKEKRGSVKDVVKKTFSTRQAWATFFCHFGIFGTYIGFIGSWGVPYGIHVFDLSLSNASQLMMVGLFGAIIGGFLISWITRRQDSIKKVYRFFHLLVFLSWLMIFLSGTKPPIIVIIFLFFLIGLGNGVSALTFAVVRKTFSQNEVGVVSGFANTGGFLSAVLLPMLFGKVIDFFPTDEMHIALHHSLIIPLTFSFVGLVGVLMIREETI